MAEEHGAPACLLCRDGDVARFAEVEHKQYWRCGGCLLTFLEPGAHPTADVEYAHYLTHENDVDDPGYRKFLGRLAGPMLARLGPSSTGLDYGCGPGPALARMLSEGGHRVTLYDPFFANDAAVLGASYDFVTCSETAEHFHDPASEFDRFQRMLKPGGWLGLMTCFQNDDAGFATWHYRRDPTHVVFYKRETLAFMAARLGWTFESPAKDIALMRKPDRLRQPDRSAGGRTIDRASM